MQIEKHSIELIGGYTDKAGTVHRRATFGNAVLGEHLFNLDTDPQATSETLRGGLILRAAITEFGSLTMPVPLTALLELDSIDRDDLSKAFDTFSAMNLGEGKAVMTEVDMVRLGVGYERNGLVYNVVKFGARLLGIHEAEADRLRLTGIRRACFLAGRQAVKLSQSEGASELEGSITLEVFERMPLGDLQAVIQGAEIYRQSFRLAGTGVSQVTGS